MRGCDFFDEVGVGGGLFAGVVQHGPQLVASVHRKTAAAGGCDLRLRFRGDVDVVGVAAAGDAELKVVAVQARPRE
jgi:hypothetical protein